MSSRMKKRAERHAEIKDKRPQAHARHIRMSPFKVRAVLDIIRGKSVSAALSLLELTPRAACEPIKKVLLSATANAEHNSGLSREDLVIAETYAGAGPVLKRMQPVSKGRGHRIIKRTSHITVILDTVKEANA
ncbi:MAG: 50S ribosomal protein L22 [Firmicutes bacterium]|nr:50S ribosomal protein L22 [Bacillota bacterium]